MTRKKIKIAYIHNDVARSATNKKRKRGAVKKLSELTTPCATKACVVLHPSGSNSQPEASPSTVPTRGMFSRYKTLPVTRMVKQVTKVTEQLEKLRKENRRMELTQVIYQNLGRNKLKNVKNEDLGELGELIDGQLKDIDKRLCALAIQED